MLTWAIMTPSIQIITLNSRVNLERYGKGHPEDKKNLIEQQTSSRELSGKTKITGFNTTLANLELPYLQTIPCGKRPKN